MEDLDVIDVQIDTISEVEDKVFYEQMWQTITGSLSTASQLEVGVFLSRYKQEQKILAIAEDYGIDPHKVVRICTKCLKILRRNPKVKSFYI